MWQRVMAIDIIYNMWINKYDEKHCLYYTNEESNEG